MIKITNNWYILLEEEFKKDYFKKLQSFLEQEYSTKTIYPKMNNIFNALNYTKFQDVKVVIIGQDPYHQPNQAHGFCFSVEKGIKIPPSLQNIYKEIKNDIGRESVTNGTLTEWAKQGILLLNSVLTVQENSPNSHKNKGWENLTTKIISILNEREDPIIFILWGANAISFKSEINTSRHFVLTASHPSPLSAYSGFFGCRHFSKTNEILRKLNKKEIIW